VRATHVLSGREFLVFCSFNYRSRLAEFFFGGERCISRSQRKTDARQRSPDHRGKATSDNGVITADSCRLFFTGPAAVTRPITKSTTLHALKPRGVSAAAAAAAATAAARSSHVCLWTQDAERVFDVAMIFFGTNRSLWINRLSRSEPTCRGIGATMTSVAVVQPVIERLLVATTYFAVLRAVCLSMFVGHCGSVE